MDKNVGRRGFCRYLFRSFPFFKHVYIVLYRNSTKGVDLMLNDRYAVGFFAACISQRPYLSRHICLYE